MKAEKTVRWFGVKAVFRRVATGKPRSSDVHYDPDATLVEERVVLLRARTPRQALARAEREATRYARQPSHENLYGQSVRLRFLADLDAFELYDPPDHAREVYSRTEVVSRRVSDREVVNKYLGKAADRKEQYIRRKFVNRTLASKLWSSCARQPAICALAS